MNGHRTQPSPWRVFGAAALVCAVSACDRQSASVAEKREAASERNAASLAREAPVTSQPPAQTRKFEGQYDDEWAKRRTPLTTDPGTETGSDKVQEAITDKAVSFAESNPRGGLQWAAQLPVRKQRDAALESLAWACSTTDLAVSIEALEQLPPGEGRSRLVPHVVGEWAVTAPDDAQSWAENRPDATERTEALAAFAVAAAETYPLRAATIVAEKIQSGAVQDRAVVAVIQRWMQSDRNAAEEWVAQFPDGPLKSAATAAIRRTIPPDPPAVATKSPATDRPPR